jgi:hypothetical protein
MFDGMRHPAVRLDKHARTSWQVRTAAFLFGMQIRTCGPYTARNTRTSEHVRTTAFQSSARP